jgi:hypothetical protein
LADQAEAHAGDQDRARLPADYPALPEDLLNFQYDPLACAVAIGWDGATFRDVPVELSWHGDLLRMRETEGAPTLRIATDVDAERFEREWLEAAIRASRFSQP